MFNIDQDKLCETITLSGLESLFGLPHDLLSNEHRLKIVNTLVYSDKLTIHTIYEFHQLWHLKELSNAHRTEILKVLQQSLSDCIQNSDQFCSLVNICNHKLSDDYIKQIWDAIHPRLGNLIKEGNHLYQLLSLKFLSDEQRHHIWRAVQGKLDVIIKTGYQLFILLQFVSEETYRTQIWTEIQGKLRNLVCDAEVLDELFQLPMHILSNEQRGQIWQAVKPTLSTLILHGGLEKLLTLHSLSDEQRKDILDAFNCNHLTYSECNELFKLSPEQLNRWQRIKIYNALEKRLSTEERNSLSSQIPTATAEESAIEKRQDAVLEEGLRQSIDRKDWLMVVYTLYCGRKLAPSMIKELSSAPIQKEIKKAFVTFLSTLERQEQRNALETLLDKNHTLRIILSKNNTLMGLGNSPFDVIKDQFKHLLNGYQPQTHAPR